MRLFTLSLAASLLAIAAATPCKPNNTIEGPDATGKYWLHTEGISAAFIPYGASITDLFINDQYGIRRDVIVGFDNASYYEIDAQHPHLGGVVGRYANRIKNSSFEIDDVTYFVEPNEHPTAEHPKGIQTLHGGPDGWDYRNWTVTERSAKSITFSLIDPSGSMGFPGDVTSSVKYTLRGMSWDIEMVAVAKTQKTPIMLASHAYWNLDGFANNETNTALDHTFYLPYSGMRVDVDNVLIPTGDLLANRPGSINDFWTEPKAIGANFSSPLLKDNCGFNCSGYDNCWLVNHPKNDSFDWRTDGFVARIHSPWSGIQLDIHSDQEAFQMYSCNGMNGSFALKETQGLRDNPDFPRTIPQYGCIVLEPQDWIDAINHPEWMREKKQIYGPGDEPYLWQASFTFSINSTKTS